ncbi:hypothetical protein IWX76_001614 [Pedobacter sp. CAN_A7]|uniref:hypothetical protein n=1 Tax=Pedobacter sp. CAN_A7 TaxID=2787722 RepID=UPI0018CAA036
MSNCLKFLLLMLFSLQSAYGQQIKGVVQDRATDLRLENVIVKNLSSNKQTLTNAKGEFTIPAAISQLLLFYQPGYLPDTLLIIDLNPVWRYLVTNDQMLKTVQIKGEAFNPVVDYHQVYQKARAIRLSQNQPLSFSPSSFFGKEGKNARRFKKRLEQEKIERKIDARFNVATVTKLTRLRDQELDNFMVLYRPTLRALEKMDEEGFLFYIMDSFKAYKLLPSEKKLLPTLSH